MEDSKIIELLEELRDATQKGEVRWQETASRDAFRIGLADNLVRVEKEYKRGYASVIVRFLNAKGTEVWHQYSDNDRSDDTFHSEYPLFSNLHSVAKASALKLDIVVGDMREALKQRSVTELPPETDPSDIPF